jgi:HK97 family phage prohead protease
MTLKYVSGPITKADAGGLEAVISTPRVDSDGEAVDPRGLRNREAWLANPLIYWAHEWAFDRGAEPIGKGTRLDVHADRIESAALFAPTAKAQNVRALVQGGFVRKTSIGFDPLAMKDVKGVPTHTDWNLLEWSVVPMPANAEASITGTKAALRWYADQIADVEEGKDALTASMTPDEIVALVAQALEDRLTLTYSESPSPLRDAPPIGGVTVRDGTRVIAAIRRRRVLTVSS